MLAMMKGQKRDPCGDGITLYPGCININILIVACTKVFQDVTIGENGIKNTSDLSALFMTMTYQSTLSKIKSIHLKNSEPDDKTNIYCCVNYCSTLYMYYVF